MSEPSPALIDAARALYEAEGLRTKRQVDWLDLGHRYQDAWIGTARLCLEAALKDHPDTRRAILGLLGGARAA